MRALLAVPAGLFACLPKGGFATGGRDKCVRLYAWDPEARRVEGPVRSLAGHTGMVHSLSLSARGELLSGALDGHVRVWDVEAGRCAQVLEGHENLTTVLGLPTGDIAVGSSGRKNQYDMPADFKLRIWGPQVATAGATSAGSGPRPVYVVKRVIEDHEGALRDLALLPGGAGFVTVSNDGTARCRGFDGSPLAGAPRLANPGSADGHPIFCYSVHCTPAGLIATCSDDATVRLYAADGSLVDQLQLPGTPWRCASLANGDLVFAGDQAGRSARGHVYVFSAAPERAASSEQVLQKWVRDIAPIPRAKPAEEEGGGGGGGGGGSDQIVTSGAYADRASRPGQRDGVNGFFVHPEGTMYCTWSAALGAWQDVGILQDGPEGPPPAGRAAPDGRSWDYSRAVTMDTAAGSTRSLTIDWNDGDDVVTVAKEFLLRNHLAEENYEEVRDFIFKVQAQEGDAVRRKKAGGGGGAGAGAPALVPAKPQYVDLTAVDFKKVWPKLVEVGRAQAAPPAAEEEAALRAVVDVLEQTSKYHATTVPRAGVKVLLKLLRAWPPKEAFPLVDVLRVLVIHMDGAKAVAECFGAALLPALLSLVKATAPLADARPATLLAARAIFNCFRNEPTRRLVAGAGDAAQAELQDAIGALLAHEHATVRYAGAVCLHNLALAQRFAEEEARAAAAAIAAGGKAGAGAGPPPGPERVMQSLALVSAGLAADKPDADLLTLLLLAAAAVLKAEAGAAAQARELGLPAQVQAVAAAGGAAAPLAKEVAGMMQ